MKKALFLCTLTAISLQATIVPSLYTFDIKEQNFQAQASVSVDISINHDWRNDISCILNRLNQINIFNRTGYINDNHEPILSTIPNISINNYIDIEINSEGINQFNLIINPQNLYLEGFYNKNNTYFYFNDSIITRVNNVANRQNLTYNGNYNDLIGSSSYMLDSSALYAAVSNLTEFNTHSFPNDIKKSLVAMIFIVPESLRFWNIRSDIQEVINGEKSIQWQDYKNQLVNWAKYSSELFKGSLAEPKKYLSVAKSEK